MHVVGPQLGLTQPGMTVVCGDIHTSTHGAFGALAFGIGTSEVEHVLATQTLPLTPFKTMAVTVDGALPDGVTAKDLILAVIARIGTGGGQGYVIEYRGEAIRALSMEARMTVCNMSIEAGARAGMIAPDETTFEYLEGRPHAPQGADWDAAVARLGDAAHRRRRGRSTPRSSSTPRELTPFVTWGTNPGQGVPLSASVPVPDDFADEDDRAAAERALEYMGLDAGHADARHHGRHGLRRLLHQRPHRGPARRRRGPPGPHGRRRRRGCSSCPGRCGCVSQAEAEGLDEVFIEAGAEWRRRRLLDVPGHEPRPAGARRAQRLDVQPQLRGPAGQGRSHAPRLPAGRRRDRRRRPPRRRPPTSTADAAVDARGPAMEKFTVHTGTALPLRRSNVDTDQIIPAVYLKRDHPHTASRTGSSPPGAATRASSSTSPQYAGAIGARRRPRLRHRLVARARGVGAAGLRLPGRASRRASPTSSAATPARTGCSPPRSTQDVVERLWDLVEADPTHQVTVDLEAREVRGRRRSTATVRGRRLHALAAARGPRRHRHHAAARGRHRRPSKPRGPRSLPVTDPLVG